MRGWPKDAQVFQPEGVAVDADGALYIADTDNHRVRKVGTDGTITTVAGTGEEGYSGDDGPAEDAQLSYPRGIAVGSDGSIYIVDTDNERVRKVSTDGEIITIAGTGDQDLPGDGGPAEEATLAQPQGVAVDSDGALYIADTENERVRRVGSPMPGRGNFFVASEDGSERYEFDSRGRHLRTLDAVTDATLFSFSYDEKGRVTSIEDVDGLTTQVERDASGDATAIVAPNGERTELTLYESGYLASVTNPAEETVKLAYDGEGGLLKSLTDAKDNPPTRSTYEEDGRIARDEDPAGGYNALSHASGEKSYSYDPRTGNPATASNDSSTLTYDFDGFLPLSETSSGEVPGEVELEYDDDLRVAGISVNGAPAVSYSYDQDSLVTEAGSLDVSRDPERGLITDTTLSGTTDQRSYSAFGELESYEALSGSEQLYETTYERDSVGRITEKTETIEGSSTTYTYAYDEEGNLEEVTQDGNVVASYSQPP